MSVDKIQPNEERPKEMKLWDQITWDMIAYNKISEQEFYGIRRKYDKCYGTILGSQNALEFYLFKPLYWGDYRNIKTKGLNKEAMHEYVINTCLLWPKLDPIKLNCLESGIVITLVYQILATSYFLSDPSKAMEMILEA